MIKYFIADPTDKARAGTPSERCINCRKEYNEHTNGACPLEHDPVEYVDKVRTILGRIPPAILIACALMMTGCAVLVPNSIPVEVTHVSHASQHFGSEPTNFGYNEVSAGLKWNVTRDLSVKVEEGIVLDKPVYYHTQDNGRQPMYGDLLGPREVFSATIAYEFKLK